MAGRYLKVLHLINNLKREGAQVVMFNLVTAGGTRARHVVCARAPGGRLQMTLAAHGVPVHVPERYHGASATRQSLRFIDRIVESESIDIIHAHMADAAFLGWLAARKRRLPLVITHHGQDILPGCGGNILCRMVYAVLLRLAAGYARCNVAVAPAVAEVLRRRLALRRGRIEVIANGVPVPEPGPAVCARPGKGLRIVSVGRLVALKGQEQLLAAAAILARHDPDLRLVIVGEGPEREALRAKARELKLGECVSFTGAVDDVSLYLRDADVFVSASQREGLPMCVLEAMAWQVPVVASDIAGHRGVIGRDETGLLFPLGNVEALARALQRVADDPGSARERARRARQSVEEHYSIGAVVRAYDRVYAGSTSTDRRHGELPTA